MCSYDASRDVSLRHVGCGTSIMSADDSSAKRTGAIYSSNRCTIQSEHEDTWISRNYDILNTRNCTKGSDTTTGRRTDHGAHDGRQRTITVSPLVFYSCEWMMCWWPVVGVNGKQCYRNCERSLPLASGSPSRVSYREYRNFKGREIKQKGMGRSSSRCNSISRH
eukprot:864516-Amphidinium_carterae.1